MGTATRTQTSTFARLELTKWQFRALLVRHFPEERSKEVYEAVLAPALDRKVLKELVLLAKDRQGFCHASLTLAMDWGRHGREMQSARLVTVEGNWATEKTAPQLKALLEHFDELVQKRRMRVSFRISLEKGDELVATCKDVCLQASSPERWASPAIEANPVTIAQLPELSVICAIAENWTG